MEGGLNWQGNDEQEPGSYGSGVGKRSNDEPTRTGVVFPYDIEFERQMWQKYPPLPPAKMQKKDKGTKEQVMSFLDFQQKQGTEPRDIPQHFRPYDYDFEMECAQKYEPIGTGHYYDRDWMSVRVGVMVTLVDVAAGRPLLLFTQQPGNAPGTMCSVAHDKHPFVAMVHLLQEAKVNSAVYMSMPYVTDKHVMDELCHFAQPEENGGRNLQIHIILVETEDNKNFINQQFLAGRNYILEACQRLKIRSTPMSPGFCHTKAIVSTAGCMVGSYNYTYAARMYNYEHAILLGPGAPAKKLEEQLSARFEVARDVVYRAFPVQLASATDPQTDPQTP